MSSIIPNFIQICSILELSQHLQVNINRNVFSIFEVTGATTRTYIMDVLEINSSETTFTLDEDTLKLMNKKIQKYSFHQATNAQNPPQKRSSHA